MEKTTSVAAISNLTEFLSSAKGEVHNVCAKVFHAILTSDDPAKVASWFFEEGFKIDSSEEELVDAYFTASKIQQLRDACENLVVAILEKLIAKNTDKETFYASLWERITNDGLFSTEEEKIYALYSVYTDRRIPYFQLESGLKLSNDEFFDISNRQANDIRKIGFVLSVKFQQRTEVASILLNIVQSYSDYNEQVVLLSHILTVARRTGMFSEEMLEKLLSK